MFYLSTSKIIYGERCFIFSGNPEKSLKVTNTGKIFDFLSTIPIGNNSKFCVI